MVDAQYILRNRFDAWIYWRDDWKWKLREMDVFRRIKAIVRKDKQLLRDFIDIYTQYSEGVK